MQQQGFSDSHCSSVDNTNAELVSPPLTACDRPANPITSERQPSNTTSQSEASSLEGQSGRVHIIQRSLAEQTKAFRINSTTQL